MEAIEFDWQVNTRGLLRTPEHRFCVDMIALARHDLLIARDTLERGMRALRKGSLSGSGERARSSAECVRSFRSAHFFFFDDASHFPWMAAAVDFDVDDVRSVMFRQLRSKHGGDGWRRFLGERHTRGGR